MLGAAGWQTGLDPRKAAAMSAGGESSVGNLTSAAHPGDTLNAYTGMLAFASLGTSSKTLMAAQNRQAVRLVGHRHHLRDRTILACLGYKSFFTSFENFIGVLLVFFVPWSAINLVDYYLVKRGRYDV